MNNNVSSYLHERLDNLGVSASQNRFTRTWTDNVSSKDDAGIITTRAVENRQEYNIFDADENDNIVIRYFNLAGQPYLWKKEGTKWPRDYVRLRLKNPKGSQKYSSPAGSPLFPFFPPQIIAKYKQALDESGPDPAGAIDTLFLIEGEFKAFKACMLNIDAIGLPGIYGFFNGDIKGMMHEDIQELIIKCRVRKIVLLMDADVLSVTWSADKDLASRPFAFYGAIKAFRESLQLLLDNTKVALELIYWMHIQPRYMKDAKGLDDLLVNYEDRSVEIQEDLAQFQLARKYFNGFIINDLSRDVQGKIFRYLGLTDEQEFYKTYKDFIGAHEFRFRRRSYIYNEEKKEVVFVKHQDADKFMRVGPDWVKVITHLNKHGEEEEDITPWKITEIMRDYRHFPGFIDQVQKYDAFCNEPAWDNSYKRVHKSCFNVCSPLRWRPERGGISSSLKFLKHIFPGKGNLVLNENGLVEKEEAVLGDTFTVALDYLSILLRYPKHMLPVPILVSPENNTGKSTFLKWLQLIFGTNMCILGNEQFKMKFNAHYITKFIIAIDEGFLEVDKKAEKERLKQLVTADTAYLEHKGMNVKKINYYGKLIICSNDADRVMKIDAGENRWFVVRVPVIREKDPDMEKKLKDEIPAVLQFLQTREIFHPRKDRLWFKEEWFQTEQFHVIVEATRNRLERVFEDWICEQFKTFRLATLRYSISYLVMYFNDFRNNKYKTDAFELKTLLKSRGILCDKRPQRFWVPKGLDVPDMPNLPTRILKEDMNPTSSTYVFRVEEWLTPDEIQALLPFTDPKKLILEELGAVPEPSNGVALPF